MLGVWPNETSSSAHVTVGRRTERAPRGSAGTQLCGAAAQGIGSPGTPHQLLRRCQELERSAHRVRDVRWGPRTLDVDIVDIGGVVSADPELTLPHPRAAERAFVLLPWLEVDPDATLGGESVAGLVGKLGEQGVRRL